VKDFFWGTAPQWITAVVALGAAAIAVYSITVQRQIARKRATIDFFLKVSMDKESLETYEMFKVQIDKFHSSFNYDIYIKTTPYIKVRIWLNICELISVGINRKVFDDRLAFDCWGDVLPWCYDQCEPLIQSFRAHDGSELSYIDLQTVAHRWKAKSVRQNYENKAKQRADETADIVLSP
jgi:hypothetical protein